MKLPFCPILLVALAVAGCIAAPGGAPSTGTSGAAIVGGAIDLEHTAVFDILVDGEQSCTGTLISPHVVLTAAHCIVEDVDDATELVVFTGSDEFDLAGGELHEVVTGSIHPTYLTDPIEDQVGDMALLILAEPSTIEPMRYNRQLLVDSMIGTPVQMVGYGDTTVEEPTSGGGRRRQATSPLVDFDEDWVLAGTRTRAQCYGDSGGPVLMELDGIEQVIGINSWQENDDCNEVNYNTRVDLLSEWIDGHVETYDPGFDGGGGGGGDGDGSGGGGDTGDGGDGPGDGMSGGGCQMTAAPLGGPGALFLAPALARVRRRRRRDLERRVS